MNRLQKVKLKSENGFLVKWLKFIGHPMLPLIAWMILLLSRIT